MVCILFTHFLKSKNVLSRGFFLKVLAICMSKAVSNQARVIVTRIQYIKAFRCKFCEARKNPCSSKFVQLKLLIRRGQDHLETMQLFTTQIHLFLFSFTQLETLHLQGLCSLRPSISRPYCSRY